MKKFSFSALIVGLLVLVASHGVRGQTTIDFNGLTVEYGFGPTFGDDLPDPGIPESANAGGFLFSINGPGSGYGITAKSTEGYNGSYCLYDNTGTPGAINTWTIKKADGTAFQFRGIYLRDAGFADVSGTITGYKGGVATGSAPASFSRTATVPLDFSANPIFFDIDEIRIEGDNDDLNFFLDQFTYGPPTSVGANDPAEVANISLVGSPASTTTTVSYTVTFTKAATNVDAGDFVLTKVGSATGAITSVTGSGTTYTAVINGISGEGSIRLDLKAGTDIENEDGLDGTAAFTGGQVHYVTSCFMETFDQGETDNATIFSGNGKNFTLTGNWAVNTETPNTGIGGSAYNLKRTSGTGPFTIGVDDGEITVNGLYLFLSSESDGANPTGSGSVTITGRRDGSQVYTFTKSSGFATDFSANSGYIYIDFSAESGDHSAKVIDQLEISIGGAFTYLNLDNFSWCEGFVPPAITSSTYDAFTGELVVTGTDLLAKTGADNDIVANKLTFTGEGGATYTLTDTQNGEISSGTSFTLVLSATDRAAVNTMLNKNGTSSSGGTTYNLAAAEDWAAGADPAIAVADTTGNGITVSNVATPTITSASYDAATGTLTVTGTGFLSANGANNDIVANKFTFTGEGGATYTLTDTQNAEISSGTSFTLVLSAADRAGVNTLMNKNGTSSSGGTTYNLAAAEDWAAGADAAIVVADTTGNGITVSNVATPTITSASYDAATGTLTVTGTGFLSATGANNDIVANKFTFTGEGGATYTLTDTQNAEISSGTSFMLVLSAADRAGVNTLMNKNGTSSSGGTTYNLAAAEDWAAGADAAIVVADTTGNGITVSNVLTPTITAASYDAATGTLTVTGTGFLSANGANNDIVANKFTFTGEGGATYTLTDTQNAEISSGTSFTLVLSAADRAGVNTLMNKNGTSSSGGTTYNLAAAEDWAAGADAAIVVADTTGNGITVSNVATPTITSASYDAATGTLTVTGTGFLSAAGANNDIVANKFTFTGEGGATYTLTDTGNGEISSGTSFTLVLSATDRAGVNTLMNENGTASSGGTTYNLAAADDWAAGADVAVTITDTTGNGITVSNVNYAPTDITLSNASVNQSAGALATVGALSAIDANMSDLHIYDLVTGEGDDNNSSFFIIGDELIVNNVATMSAGNYSVRIETDDQKGGTFSKALTITVVDDIGPTVTITSDKASLKAGETTTVTFTLSEASTDFDMSDVTFEGGIFSPLSESSSTLYTATFTPTDNATATATIDVAAGTFTDAASNNNTAATQLTIEVDTKVPTVNISSGKTSLKDGETTTLTFTLSEASTDFTLTDLTVTDGTISGFSGTGTLYTATFTPPANATMVVTINVDADEFTDAAGNGNTAASPLAIAVDTELPTVTIGSDKTSLKSGETATLTFTLSEASDDFELDDVTAAGGTLSAFSKNSSTSYSATFTPSDNATVIATIDVNADAFTDAAGNGNFAATQQNIAIDTSPPSGYDVSINQATITLANFTALSFTFSGAEVGATFDYEITSNNGGTPVTGNGNITAPGQQVSGIDVYGLANGTLTLSVTLTDASGNTGDPATDNVTKAVSYPPTITTSGGTTTFTESVSGSPVPVPIDDALTVSDPDNTTLASATVAITGNFYNDQDVLGFVNDGISMGNIDGSYTSGVLTLTSSGNAATLAQWEAALRAVTYSNTSLTPNTSNRTISYVVNDGLDDSTPGTKTVAVQAVNNTPVITNVDGDAITFTEDGPAVLIDAGGDATVSDPDSPDFNGGNLTVSIIAGGVGSEDLLAIRNEGMGAGQIGTSDDNDVYYGGVHIGSANGGIGGADLIVTFLPTATPDAVQALIRNLTYGNSNIANPSADPRTVRVTLNDGDGATSAPSDLIVNITAVNDAPMVTTSGGAVTFTEPEDGDPVPTAIDPGLTVADPDNASLASATVSVTGNFQAGEDVLMFVNDGSTMGNIDGSYNETTGILNLTAQGGTAALAEWQAALRAIAYSNTSQTPNTATRTISFIVNDGAADSAPATKAVNVVAVNTAPVAVDDPLTVNEDIPATGNVLTNDSDVEGNALTASLVTAPVNGTVVLNADGSFTYTPNSNYNGPDSLEYQVCDNGTPSRCDTAWVRFAIGAINDAPVITAPATLAADEDVLTDLTGISFVDVDAGSADVTATFSVTSGTLSAISGSGVTVIGSGTSALTLTGPITDLNAFVAAGNVGFTTVLDATDDVTLTVHIDDGGNTGTDPGNSGTADSEVATTTVAIMVTAQNDAPVNTVPGSQTTDQNSAIVFNTSNGNALSVSDADVANGSIRVTLTATNGLLTLSGTSGLVFVVGSGTGDGTMTFEGTLADINAALNDLTFTPTSGFNGPASLQIVSNDLGLTGVGGVQTDTDAIAITVNPINPVVTAVGSASPDETYKIGDVINLTLAFDQAVTVDESGGTPSLLLETGATDRGAVYISGSGSHTLTFAYTVGAGDESADLDYQSTAALTLNGATIQNASGNDAVLTLPALGGANSIAGQHDIVIDGIAPEVTSVDVPADGYYREADALLFTVHMSEGVTVNDAGGTPYLEITIGTAVVQATYTGGSGTDRLTFSYTVQTEDEDLDGIALGGDIILGGGMLHDNAGNEAVIALNGVAPTDDVFISSVRPSLVLSTESASSVNGPFAVTATFSEAVTGFTLNDISVANGTLSDFQSSDNTSYTFLVTPVERGNVQLSVAANVAVNVANNGNSLSNTLNVQFDEIITGITFADGSFVYDGTTHSLTVTGTLPDGASVSYEDNSRTNVGMQEVTATITGSNYQALKLTAELTVSSLPITVMATAQTKVFGTTDPELTYTFTPELIGSDAFTGGLTRVEGEEVGDYAITQGTLALNSNYAITFEDAELIIIPAEITGVTFADGSFVYDGTAHSLAISGELPEGTTVSYANNSRTNVGTQEVTATISGGSYKPLVLKADLTISPAARSIEFPEIGEKTYGDADFDAGATASSGEAVSYSSSNSSVAEIVEGKIHITGAGMATITATVSENDNYTDRPSVSRSFRVAKAAQEISFVEVGEVSRDAGSIELDVSSGSGLGVSLSVDDEQVATVEGTTLNIQRLGTVHVTATQAGNGNYLPADPVTVLVRVIDENDALSLRVHKALSPNGDGINEFLMVEGVKEYPENRVIIINRNGNKVAEIVGYNNADRVFRGIGQGNELLPPGTYYYLLEVKVEGEWKYRKGYFVIRY